MRLPNPGSSDRRSIRWGSGAGSDGGAWNGNEISAGGHFIGVPSHWENKRVHAARARTYLTGIIRGVYMHAGTARNMVVAMTGWNSRVGVRSIKRAGVDAPRPSACCRVDGKRLTRAFLSDLSAESLSFRFRGMSGKQQDEG